MTLTFLELELPLGIVRDRLTEATSGRSVECESPLDWERLILDAMRQQLSDGELLRWALTSVCDRRQTIIVEVVATQPASQIDT